MTANQQKFELIHFQKFAKVAKFARAVQIDAGRLAVDAPLANRVRSGRKQP